MSSMMSSVYSCRKMMRVQCCVFSVLLTVIITSHSTSRGAGSAAQTILRASATCDTQLTFSFYLSALTACSLAGSVR